MLSLSLTTGYAILALSCLEGPGGRPIPVPDVARCRGIPETYLSKIVQSLSAKGLVKTKRGSKGGLLLTRPPDEVTLWDVAECIEGAGCIGTCLLGIEDCSEFCPTHPFWQEERRRIEAELRSRNLTEMPQYGDCRKEFHREEDRSQSNLFGSGG